MASEYLVMAATLLAIKSKMLIPVIEKSTLKKNLHLEMDEDPREELVERLIEYRKYKEVASDLKSLEEERGLLYTKPPSDLSNYAKDIEVERKPVKDVSLYDMLSALQKLLRRKKLQKPLLTKVTRQEIPIEQKMKEIIFDLKKKKSRTSFFDLFSVPDKEHIVVTFLAVLELMKQNEILVEQDTNFAEIFVSAVGGTNRGNE